MSLPSDYTDIIRAAWRGRISGCMLGKAVEQYSMLEGYDALSDYLRSAGAVPLRDYVPYVGESAPDMLLKSCCAEYLDGARPDDDINYSVLALIMLEAHGKELSTIDVARAWLRYLPAANTYTAERAAYRILLGSMEEWFPEGMEPGFDLSKCSDNAYNDCIGAQIRADVYGWVCPGNAELAVRLVCADAGLSHRGEGVYGAMFVAALSAEISCLDSLEAAVEAALTRLPASSESANIVRLAQSLVDDPAGDAKIREKTKDLAPVHTVNNLGLVVWALLRHQDDFSAAVGDVVAAGLDTDCNGATVGALWALQGKDIPARWYQPWRNRVAVTLAGQSELNLDDLVERTVRVAEGFAKA